MAGTIKMLGESMRRKGEESLSGGIQRRDFLRLAGGATMLAATGLLAACGSGTGSSSGLPDGQGEATGEAGEGRLTARPGSPPETEAPATGLQPLGLGADRDGFVYVPAGYGADSPSPLVLMLHGAGSNAQDGLSPVLDLADEAGLVLLAPDSRARTWDIVSEGGFGADVEFVDQALGQTFDGLNVDAEKLAVAGFSDGASYALSLGLTNGDLFTHVVAFSPGFSRPTSHTGELEIFVSHGTDDGILPIEDTSRRIVPLLEREGYEVRYEEFDGPHTVPEGVAREALDWFAAG